MPYRAATTAAPPTSASSAATGGAPRSSYVAQKRTNNNKENKGTLVWIRSSLVPNGTEDLDGADCNGGAPTRRAGGRRLYGRAASGVQADASSTAAATFPRPRSVDSSLGDLQSSPPAAPDAAATPASPPPPTTNRPQAPSRTKSNDSGLDRFNGRTSSLRKRQSSPTAAVANNKNLVEESQPYEWTKGWILTTSTTDGGGSGYVSSTGTGDEDNSKAKERNATMTIRVDTASPSGSKEIEVPSSLLHKDVLLANDPSKDPPHDLVTLKHFHEPAIVECLRRRFQKGWVYTATGPVLIAVNPFQALPDLYDSDRMHEYWDAAEQGLSNDDLPPHVYRLGDDVFRNMMRGMELALGRRVQSPSYQKVKCDQSILVSGESGAGKTVTTKYLMKYLTALSQRAAQQAIRSQTARSFLLSAPARTKKADGDGPSTDIKSDKPQEMSLKTVKKLSSSIEDQVLQSNPILEAFGNARTVRNDNSSRFGKFIQMQFTSTGRLVGTKIDTYLLEKVRLVHQAEGERNYHVFYQLLHPKNNALDWDEELVSLHLTRKDKPEDFSILNQSGTYDRRDGISDEETFNELLLAMKTMGFTFVDRHNVLAVTAAILHASNLTFREVSSEESGLDRDNSRLQPACDLLGVTADALNEALCYFTITAGGNKLRRPQHRDKTRKGLEALLKATYGALFDHLVAKVNELVAFKETETTVGNPLVSPAASIDILDIFGFESFRTNSFEQLCINYCNEVLQQQFNSFMLKNEQAIANEGIDWNFIKFPENQDVLDLICDPRKGILPILDDMCRAPNATDKSFAQQVFSLCGDQSRFSTNPKQTSTPKFAIEHYAGSVEYTCEGFVEKNRDELPRETVDLLMSSTNPFVHQLAEIIAASSNNSSSAKSPTSKSHTSARSAATVGGYFRQQVQDLRGKIDATAPNYVRCIKPNGQLVPKQFDDSMVAQQLRCGGILQAVSVTRDGFTLHYTFNDFIKRYGNLVGTEASKKHKGSKSSAKDVCKALVDILLAELKKEHELEARDSDNNSDNLTTTDEDPPETLIEFGKSKVLLKHRAFESLERRLRSLEDSRATRLNTYFRRHLARVVFQSARDEFRRHLKEDLGQTFDEWFKENRELYYGKRNKNDLGVIPNIYKLRMDMYQKQASSGGGGVGSRSMSRNSSSSSKNKDSGLSMLKNGSVSTKTLLDAYKKTCTTSAKSLSSSSSMDVDSNNEKEGGGVLPEKKGGGSNVVKSGSTKSLLDAYKNAASTSATTGSQNAPKSNSSGDDEMASASTIRKGSIQSLMRKYSNESLPG